MVDSVATGTISACPAPDVTKSFSSKPLEQTRYLNLSANWDEALVSSVAVAEGVDESLVRIGELGPGVLYWDPVQPLGGVEFVSITG